MWGHVRLLYVNNMSNIFRILHFILFSGDTNVYLSDHNVERLIATANTELNKLSSWFLTNCLTVNVSKCKFNLFHSRKA